MIKFSQVDRGMVFFIEEIPGIRKPYVVLTRNEYSSGERSLVAPIVTSEYTEQDGAVNFVSTNGKNAIIDLNKIISVNRKNLVSEYFNEALSRKIVNNRNVWDDIDSAVCSVFNIAPIVFGTHKSDITTQNSQPIQVIVNVSDYKKESENVSEQIFSESKVTESKECMDTETESQDISKSVESPNGKRRYSKRMTVDVAKQFLKDYKTRSKNYMIKKYEEYGVDSIRRLYDRVHKSKLLIKRDSEKVSV